VPEPTGRTDDADGDGTVDVLDNCPSEGGPAQNGGCPVDDSDDSNPAAPTATPSVTLPALSRDGACVLATRSTQRVNVRRMPTLNSNIAFQLDPVQIYPVYWHIIGATLSDSWYRTTGGWVNHDVVRLGGDCSELASMVGATLGLLVQGQNPSLIPLDTRPFDPQTAPSLPAFYLQICDTAIKIHTGPQEVTSCDGSVIPFDGMDITVECDGEQYGLIDPEICPQATSFGILLSPNGMDATDNPQAAALVLTIPGSLVGFNPQPEPPAPVGECLANFGVSPNGLAEVGFNPQPEPPAPQSCIMIVNGGSIGSSGFTILGDVDGERRAIGIDSRTASAMTFLTTVPVSQMVMPPDTTAWTQMVDWRGNVLLIGVDEESGGTFLLPTDIFGFNPQPEPPASQSNNTFDAGLGALSFNPQPEPPGPAIPVGAGGL